MKEHKRIVFINLHSDWMLLKTAAVYLFHFSPAVKHGYLLNYLLENPEYEVCSYINDRGFSWLRNDSQWLMKLLNLFRFAEHRKTLRVNGLPKKSVTVLKSAEQIRPDDIVIAYNICRDNYRSLSEIDAFKAMSMLHFHGVKEESAMIQNAGIDCFFNEVNLFKCCELFRAYYDNPLPWVIHPFVYAQRFQNKIPFSQRKNMAFATGTITYKNHEEFLSVYSDPCDQPTRKQIKDDPEFFKDTVFCTSSDYLEDDPGKIISPRDSVPVRLYKKIYNRTHVGKQKKYYSFDMVEAFNTYKMCIVGEEILGIPGIGFAEGMACGCAYIGQDLPAYRDWGLIPGVHYISYDGTKEDLKRVIEYYQADAHQTELEQIAATGCTYVRSKFNGRAVAEELMRELEAQQGQWLSEKA